jgi:uncharacterized lipoprotein YmbA
MREITMLYLCRWLSVSLLVVFQAACSLGNPSPSSDFYVLSAEPGQPVASQQVRPAGAPLSLGVGPIIMPDIFDRPQIVTRPETNRIDLNEYNRWGGNISQDVQRVLIQDLMAQLNTDHVFAYPWERRGEPLFQVTVRFFHFDGEPGKQARLTGSWQLLEGDKGCLIATHRFDIQEPAVDNSYGAYVGALSRGLASLGRSIAQTVVQSGAGCSAATE